MKKQRQPISDKYVCATVCAECPFRTVGSQAVRIDPRTADRIKRDLIDKREMFPCHLTSTPNGLGTETMPRGDWRFCAGAYVTMSAQERYHNTPLQVAAAFGFHDPEFVPAGAQLCFTSMEEFLTFYHADHGRKLARLTPPRTSDPRQPDDQRREEPAV